MGRGIGKETGESDMAGGKGEVRRRRMRMHSFWAQMACITGVVGEEDDVHGPAEADNGYWR